MEPVAASFYPPSQSFCHAPYLHLDLGTWGWIQAKLLSLTVRGCQLHIRPLAFHCKFETRGFAAAPGLEPSPGSVLKMSSAMSFLILSSDSASYYPRIKRLCHQVLDYDVVVDRREDQCYRQSRIHRTRGRTTQTSRSSSSSARFRTRFDRRYLSRLDP